MRPRSKAREIALCILYQVEIAKRDYVELLNIFYEDNPQRQEIVEFASQLVEGIIKNLPSIDSLIRKYAKNWEIERMAVVDRNIIRMGIFEIIFLDDIPPKVSINEAIELAKRFGDKDSPRFVNGVLDKIYKLEGSKTEEQPESDEKS